MKWIASGLFKQGAPLSGRPRSAHTTMAVAGSGSAAEESAAMFGHTTSGSRTSGIGGGGGAGAAGNVGNSSDSGATGSNMSGQSGWAEFCERHARAAASDFAKSCVHYINKNLPENVRSTVSHRDFMSKFIECFSDHFDSEFSRRRSYSKVSGSRPSVTDLELGINCVYYRQTENGRGPATVLEESSADYPDAAVETPKPHHKPFFRRLSFKGLRRGKVLVML